LAQQHVTANAFANHSMVKAKSYKNVRGTQKEQMNKLLVCLFTLPWIWSKTLPPTRQSRCPQC